MKDVKNKFLLWNDPRGAILTIMFILIAVGCINIYSAQFTQDGFKFLNFIIKYCIIVLVSWCSLWFVRRKGYKYWLRNQTVVAGVLLTIVFLGLVLAVGPNINGARRWLGAGGVTFQPSELAKLALIMLSASFLGSLLERGKKINPFEGQCGFVSFCTAIIFVLVAIEPDLGTGAIIAGLVVCMYIIAGMSMSYMGWTLGSVVALFAIFVWLEPFRLRRFAVWLDPWIDERGAGFQMVQALKGIGSAGFAGKSWGMGMVKHYLPEPHTDFAFAVFCEENGFLGAMLLAFFYTLLAYAFIKIVFYTRDKKGFLLASGVTTLIIGQAFSNMAMVCGILPVIGVPLPFISYGGSSMLVTLVAIGLILSVYDEEERRRQQESLSPEARRQQLHIYHPPTRGWRQ